MEETRKLCVGTLGIRPYDFDFGYQIKDVDSAVQAYKTRQQNKMDGLRFHAFLVMAGFTDKIKRPQDLAEFPWDDEKTGEFGLRGMSKEEWLKEVEEFNKRSGIIGGTGHSK